MFELKPLTKKGIKRALGKVERYRLLNEPWEAESICRDVLEVEPDNSEAIIGLILALTDQFGDTVGPRYEEARRLVGRLEGEYEQAYYAGILCERRGKAYFERSRPGGGRQAYEWYRKAMEWFEKAEAVRPAGNEDAALRWNTCARMIMQHPTLRPAPEDDVGTMLE